MAKLFYFSDIHCYLFPTNYINADDTHTGLFEIAKKIEPDSLVLDGGDNLQGSLLARHVILNKIRPLPQALAFKAAKLAGFTLGNHDFNYGREVIEDLASELNLPLLNANLKDDLNRLKPKQYQVYTMKDGLKLGVVGITTDFVNVWEKNENLETLHVTDCVDAAKKAFKALTKESVDYTILVYHGGFEEKKEGQYIENRGTELSTIGFDVILTAHQHLVMEPTVIGKSLVLQVGCKGMQYALLEFSKNQHEIKAQLLKAQDGINCNTAAVEKVQQQLQSLEDSLAGPLDEVIGNLPLPFCDNDKLESAMYGSSLVDFFNQVQQDFTKADISITALFNDPITLNKEVTLRGLLTCYPFPNTLTVIEVDGFILKTALERVASYFAIQNNEIVISERFTKPKVEHYNYDYYSAIEYEFCISKPLESRVVKLNYKGHDLLTFPEKKLSLVLNNYRQSGTGGYEVFSKCKILKQYSEDMQELLIEYVKSHKTISLPPKGNFKVHI